MESVAYEELLQKDGRIMTHVVGTSMLPLLYNRESIVIVESIDRVSPRRGDVVLYKMGGTFILHRIMRIKENEYLIRGDNTWIMEHVPKGNILAVMTGFYRFADGRLISRNNFVYRIYILSLPCIRLVRIIRGKFKRKIRYITCRKNS